MIVYRSKYMCVVLIKIFCRLYYSIKEKGSCISLGVWKIKEK
jgi:hypothetical protein